MLYSLSHQLKRGDPQTGAVAVLAVDLSYKTGPVSACCVPYVEKRPVKLTTFWAHPGFQAKLGLGTADLVQSELKT